MNRDPMAAMIEFTFKEGRKAGMSVAAVADIVAEAIRAKIGEMETEGLSKSDCVSVQSIVGARSGDPYVQCKVGLEGWQWDIPEAREHAYGVLQCAEAAIHDAAMVRWMTLGPMGLDRTAAFGAISDLRRFRGDVEREYWPPNDAKETQR